MSKRADIPNSERFRTLALTVYNSVFSPLVSRTGTLLPLFFFIVATLMFLRTFDWPWTSAVWPRSAGLWVMVGSSLILLNRFGYLPTILKPLMVEEQTLGGDIAEKIESTEYSKEESEEDVSEDTETEGVSPALAAMLFILGYVGMGELIGLFWATPIFTLLYCRYFGLSRKIILSVTVFTTLAAYGYWHFMNLPISGGILFNGQEYLRVVERAITTVYITPDAGFKAITGRWY